MSAEEEDMYDVCATASDLVDAMRLRFWKPKLAPHDSYSVYNKT